MQYEIMSYRKEPEGNGILDKILAIFEALYNAMRQGISRLVQYYRNLLASYGYNTSTNI